jgi:hypothetical protein
LPFLRIRRNLSGSPRRSSTSTCCLMSQRSGAWTSGCLIRRRICLRGLEFLWRSIAFAFACAFTFALFPHSNECVCIVDGTHWRSREGQHSLDKKTFEGSVVRIDTPVMSLSSAEKLESQIAPTMRMLCNKKHILVSMLRHLSKIPLHCYSRALSGFQLI